MMEGIEQDRLDIPIMRCREDGYDQEELQTIELIE